MKNLFLFAGEMSGDLHGSRLMQELRFIDPSVKMRGVGGPAMRKQDLEILLPMEEFQVMGFSAVVKALPRLWKHFKQILQDIIKNNPDGVILIDYPGFNLRLAKALRRKNFRGKIIQYISPTVWAHGKNRIKTMAENLDLLLTIYPFEEKYFSHTPLKTIYAGNPLEEQILSYDYDNKWKEKCSIPNANPLIALFPGSRAKEIENNLPLQLEAAQVLKKRHPNILFGLSYTNEKLLVLIHSFLQKSELINKKDIFLIPKAYSYELMKDSQSALAKSGTVTLELALHQCPTVMVYQLGTVDYFVAKYLLCLQLPHYCIVNIISNKEIFPEFVGKKLDAHQIVDILDRITNDQSLRATIKKECSDVRASLAGTTASHKAALAIKELYS